MRNFVLTSITVTAISSHAVAAEVLLSGTCRLVGEQRTIVHTGEVRRRLRGATFRTAMTEE
jgi:hypothetical protein